MHSIFKLSTVLISIVAIFTCLIVLDRERIWESTKGPQYSACDNEPLESNRTKTIDKELVGRLEALHLGHQMGNQVYEVMSFIGIARYLGRGPVLISGDKWHKGSVPHFLNLISRFPNILSGVEVRNDPEFWQKKSIPRVYSSRNCSTCYEDMKQLIAPHKNEPIIVLTTRYIQNLRYLEMMPFEEVRYRLKFPEGGKEMAREFVPPEAFETEQRLCIHTRRGDFITTHHDYTKDDFVFAAVRTITHDHASLSIILFGDDVKYLKHLRDSAEFEQFLNRTFIPINTPPHFVWMFMEHYCEKILLTASSSSFGFWGAYLAGDRVQVYHNEPRGMRGSRGGWIFPKKWILLDF